MYGPKLWVPTEVGGEGLARERDSGDDEALGLLSLRPQRVRIRDCS